MTVPDVPHREVERLERFARRAWFGLVAPPEIRGQGAPDLRARDAVWAFFAQRDLGTLRAAVDHTRAFADDECPGVWIDDDVGFVPLHRETAAVRECLSRLEHALASQVLQEAWSCERPRPAGAARLRLNGAVLEDVTT